MAENRAKLLQIIDEQKQEIEKYKRKLRDVVTAHRNLIKEKEALEHSLNALNSGGGNNETEDAKQVAALVASLNTVTAAKAALETSLLSDNKLLREEKNAAERERDELTEAVRTHQIELEEWKKRLMAERHDRDREQADHGAVMKELQQLLATERQQRMTMEATTEQQRGRVVDDTSADVVQYKKELEKVLRELDRTRRRLEIAESSVTECPLELVSLQEQVRALQTNHEGALQRERQRTQHAEERAKKHALVQEARIINLENRLAELSNTVGTYDKLRQHHEAEISELRHRIATAPPDKSDDGLQGGAEDEKAVVQGADGESEESVRQELTHDECEREMEVLRSQLSQLMVDRERESTPDPSEVSEVVRALQARVRALTDEMEARESQHAHEIDHCKHRLKQEKTKARQLVQAAESEWRGKLHLLEGQLEKLRDRSVAMLREKDQQIQQIQGSMQSVLPGGSGNELSWHGPRMLHYANEVARRDVEMAALRRSKHNLEEELREAQRDHQSLGQQIKDMNDEIARLSRCQERGGANMEYLKNVVMNFLMTSDPAAKRHMCNAIAAVLKLTPLEQERIAKQPHNTWYTPAS